MLKSLSLIALLAFPGLFAGSGPRTETRHIGSWTLSVRTDSFRASHRCKLGIPRADYRRQVVIFHVPGHSDPINAAYRVDGAAPVRTDADQMELAQLGFSSLNDDLTNPGVGLVRIPAHRLLGASVVAIELKPFERPIAYKIAGLQSALDAAQASGCGGDDFR